MPRTVYEDGATVPQLEISGKDRERIAAISARRALKAALYFGSAITVLIGIATMVLEPSPRDWPLWVNAAFWFVVIYLAFFTWNRNDMLRKTQDMLDEHNKRMRAEGQMNGRTDRTRLADDRGES